MNEKTVVFGDAKIRIILVDCKPWFIARDVCEVIGISGIKSALEKLETSETRIFTESKQGTNYETVTVNESGLYDLMISGKKEITRNFQRWITNVILPLIRKKWHMK